MPFCISFHIQPVGRLSGERNEKNDGENGIFLSVFCLLDGLQSAKNDVWL